MDFAYPWALLAVPLPLVVWFLAPPLPQKSAVQAPDSVIEHLRRHSAPSAERFAGVGALMLKAIAWAAIIIALSSPFLRQTALLSPTGRDIIVAIDLSASMAEEDMVVSDRKYRRIDIIRDRMAEFLKTRSGDRVALIGFAEDAFLIAPFSFDVKAVAEMLGEAPIGLPGRKTDLGRAIGLAVKTLRNEPAGERLLILISDGEANAGDLAASDAAEMARDAGVRMFAIGFAADLEVANARRLADLAIATQGEYISASDPASMDAAVRMLADLAPSARNDAGTERRRDLAWPFAALAILCMGVLMWREAGDP